MPNNKSMIVNNHNAYYDRKSDGGYHHRGHQSISNAIPHVASSSAAGGGDYKPMSGQQKTPTSMMGKVNTRMSSNNTQLVATSTKPRKVSSIDIVKKAREESK